MKKYTKPAVEVEKFTVEDVITNSTDKINPDIDYGDLQSIGDVVTSDEF